MLLHMNWWKIVYIQILKSIIIIMMLYSYIVIPTLIDVYFRKNTENMWILFRRSVILIVNEREIVATQSHDELKSSE